MRYKILNMLNVKQRICEFLARNGLTMDVSRLSTYFQNAEYNESITLSFSNHIDLQITIFCDKQVNLYFIELIIIDNYTSQIISEEIILLDKNLNILHAHTEDVWMYNWQAI